MLQHIQPTVKFSKLILVEPMISVEGGHHLDILRSRLISNSSQRQNTWPSKEEAYKSLKRRTRNWDPRVVQAFMVCPFFFSVYYALMRTFIIGQNHAIYRNPQTKVFTLSCSPEQETVSSITRFGKRTPLMMGVFLPIWF